MCSVVKLATLELSAQGLSWTGEMWTLKQDLENLLKFLTTEAILDRCPILLF